MTKHRKERRINVHGYKTHKSEDKPYIIKQESEDE